MYSVRFKIRLSGDGDMAWGGIAENRRKSWKKSWAVDAPRHVGDALLRHGPVGDQASVAAQPHMRLPSGRGPGFPRPSSPSGPIEFRACAIFDPMPLAELPSDAVHLLFDEAPVLDGGGFSYRDTNIRSPERACRSLWWLDKGKAPFSSVAEPTELPDYRGSTRNANQNGGNRE
jgi:hypothetical protein